MENKQSSIDYLIEQLEGENNRIAMVVGIKKYNSIVKEAKAMHKEEIIDAIFFGMQKGLNVNKVPETDNDWVNNYYNETFGGEN